LSACPGSPRRPRPPCRVPTPLLSFTSLYFSDQPSMPRHGNFVSLILLKPFVVCQSSPNIRATSSSSRAAGRPPGPRRSRPRAPPRGSAESRRLLVRSSNLNKVFPIRSPREALGKPSGSPGTGMDRHGRAWTGMGGHRRASAGMDGHGRAWKGMEGHCAPR